MINHLSRQWKTWCKTPSFSLSGQVIVQQRKTEIKVFERSGEGWYGDRLCQSHTSTYEMECVVRLGKGMHSVTFPDGNLRWENRPDNRSPRRETGLEMPCFPPSDLLWVQITQSYPNRLRFSRSPCPQSPCHTVIDPVFKEGFFWR
jgi:hypothetical protein